MKDIIWLYKPKYDNDMGMFLIKDFISNEEEVFYNVLPKDIHEFSPKIMDNRPFKDIYKNIIETILKDDFYQLYFKDENIDQIVFYKRKIYIVFNSLNLKDFYKTLLLIYNIFLSRIYYKSKIDVKVISFETIL